MEKKAPQKGVTGALDQLAQVGNKTYRTSKDWYDLASHMRQAEQPPIVNLTYTGTTTAACYASAADILNTAHFENK